MFCGSRTEAQEINETIDKQLKAEGLKAQDVVQLLLLGMLIYKKMIINNV